MFLSRSGRSWTYEDQVERRRERRRKGPQLYDLTKLEEDTRQLEWKRLEYMHDAAEYSDMPARNFSMCNVLDLNLGLNEYREEWDKAVKQHAVVAVTYLSRYHPAFRQLDVSKVFCLIYRFASMPSVPDTGPVPTLR